METFHNPDRYMADLRQILSQGRKRIGLLVGAGAPLGVRVNGANKLDPNGTPLIPGVDQLTKKALEGLNQPQGDAAKRITDELGKDANIERILSQVRLMEQALGSATVGGLDGKGYGELAATICDNIGKVVGAILPAERNPYTELVSWVSGTSRSHAVEIFTTNYDLLFEEAFERARAPYFDGFSGGNSPFFDPVTVAGDDLPSRWSRLWKLHGSIGWALENNSVVRSGGRNVTQLVYPDHLKYDLTQKQPYAALFERLKHFLLTPDTLILATGFSFRDAHVCAVLDETLAMNANTAVFAFQYEKLEGSSPACVLAQDHPNFSVYAPNGAVIRGVMGEWRVGDPPKHWADIRASYWDIPTAGTSHQFLLGNFASFARFCALAQASDVVRDTKTQEPKTSAPIKDNNEPVPEATQ